MLLIIRVKIVILKPVSEKEKMPFHAVLSSAERKVLRVSYCDNAVSVVRCPSSSFCLVYSLEAR